MSTWTAIAIVTPQGEFPDQLQASVTVQVPAEPPNNGIDEAMRRATAQLGKKWIVIEYVCITRTKPGWSHIPIAP
jgi:hypothetical protein